ncbi:MAG: hypothetical protein AAF443_01460 [Chlamydiota bacterium]
MVFSSVAQKCGWGIATFFSLVGVALSAFEQSPYFTTLAEFYFRPSYSYRYYPDINRGFNPCNYSSHDHLFDVNLGVRFLPNWEAQAEIDFATTRAMSFGLRRTGLQVRYLFLDDVAGDPVSLVAGAQVFYVPTRNLRDVSSPYHAQGNAELGISIGKEIDRWDHWIAQVYTFLGLGIANRGFPWARCLVVSTFQWKKRHRVCLFGEGYFGFGNRDRVNVRRFNGYAKIEHHSIDIGLRYSYVFLIWGSLGMQYAYRVYAHAFPERAHTLTLEYNLPFSIF